MWKLLPEISSLYFIPVSGISDASFEELVVIQEKQENAPESSHLAVREEADRLSALDALAVRSGLSLAKQVWYDNKKKYWTCKDKLNI